jgi:hypothetical protein
VDELLSSFSNIDNIDGFEYPSFSVVKSCFRVWNSGFEAENSEFGGLGLRVEG